MVLVATVVAQLAVLRRRARSTSPLAQDPSWIRPSSLLVVALTASGFLLLAIATSARRPNTAVAEHDRQESRPKAVGH